MTFPNPFAALSALWRLILRLFSRRPTLVPQRVAEQRKQICRACTMYYDPETRQCRKCGCFIALKANLSTERCPIDKWPE